MKKNVEMKSMTMSEALEALNEAVNAYNETAETAERVRLEVDAADLADQYNQLSKLVVYADALNDKTPVAYVVKKHHYSTVSVKYSVVTDVKDGKTISKKVGSVKSGTKNVDLFDFIAYAETKNRKVAANDSWKTVLNAQRKIINAEFNKSVISKTDYKVSKTTANNVLQKVFDALLFVPGESGKNSIFPNLDCKNLIIACAAEYKETINEGDDVDATLGFFKNKRWQSIIQSALFLVLKNKPLTYVFGDPEAEANDDTVKTKKPESAKKKPEAAK